MEVGRLGEPSLPGVSLGAAPQAERNQEAMRRALRVWNYALHSIHRALL
jgi:hypothetical protein